MNYYERHIGDYLKDTAHLSLLEHGIYSRLLDVYYTREGAIPVGQVERLIGVRSKDEKAALVNVLGEFFTVDADMLKHRRCDREIARYQDKQRKAKASAEERWAQSKRNANALPNAMRTHSEGNALQSPVTSNQTPVTSGGESASAKPPPQISEEFREHIAKTRPDLDALLVFALFAENYEPEKQTLARWKKWVAGEKLVPIAVSAADPDSRASIEACGQAMGLGKWDELKEPWATYKARVRRVPA